MEAKTHFRSKLTWSTLPLGHSIVGWLLLQDMNVEPCSLKCSFVNCVNDLSHVITKATSYQFKQFVASHCQTALWRYDSCGRLPIHVAASCGNCSVLEWILTKVPPQVKGKENVNIDTVDKESHWTALHRAVYYGRIPCLVLLLKNGANMYIRDKDGCNVIDMMLNDVAPWLREPAIKRYTDVPIESWSDLQRSGRNELYTWGINGNLTLAHSSGKSKTIPEVVQTFARMKLSIQQSVICKFHSVFIADNGNAYSCGSGGNSGRLGTGKENICIEPQCIGMDTTKFVAVAASIYHTVLVSDNHQVYACGLNHFRVLGINPPPNKCTKPTRVTIPGAHLIIGCAAGMCHTVLWSNKALFTFGTNAGQLGHAKEDFFVTQPRQVSSLHKENDQFTDVHACDSATVVATSQGTIYLLQKYICRKILSKHRDILKVQIGWKIGLLSDFTGLLIDFLYCFHTVLSPYSAKMVKFPEASHLPRSKEENLKNNQRELKILILKKSGNLLSWSSSHSTIDRCRFDSKQLRCVRDVAISSSGNSVLLVAVNGTAYFANYLSWKPGKKRSLLNHKQEYFSEMELASSDSIQRFQLDQIPSAFRAHTAILGPKGRNSALLQCDPCSFITQVPMVDAKDLNDDFKEFWQNASDSDMIHDVIIEVNNSGRCDLLLPAHLFVLAARSRYFFDLISARLDSPGTRNGAAKHAPWPHLVIENIDAGVFKSCVEFIYTGKCGILESSQQIENDSFKNCSSMEIFWKDRHDTHITDMLSRNSSQIKSKRKSRKGTVCRKALLRQLLSFLEIHDFNCLMENSGSLNTLSFLPASCPMLYDCEIECDDGVAFTAHKCILAARIPYFHGMLLSPWIESSHKSKAKLKRIGVAADTLFSHAPDARCKVLVNTAIVAHCLIAYCTWLYKHSFLKQRTPPVPMASDIFRFVLEFAYLDTASSISGAQSIERLCEILAAADLLLMDKLKQVAEAQIVPFLTLKNVVMVINVTIAFNGNQLFDSCLQFACHHLPALLQTPSFHNLDLDVLEKLESVYRSSIKNVYTRAMPASIAGPTVDHIPKFDTLSLDNSKQPSRKSSEASFMFVNASKQKGDDQSIKRKSSAKKPFGILISDLLTVPSKSAEEELLEKISSKPSELTDVTVIPDLSDTVRSPTAKLEKPKRANGSVAVMSSAKAADQVPASKSWDVNQNKQNSTETLSAAVTTPRKTQKHELTAANVNYNLLFPQLGAAGNENVNSKPVKPALNTVHQSTPHPAGVSGALLTKPKKKLSNKEKRRRKSEENGTKTSTPVDIKNATANAWGISPKSPERSEKGFWSGNSLEEHPMECVIPASPLKSPLSSNQGVWQRFPPAPTSPIKTTMQRSDSAAQQSQEASSQSFADIIRSEQRSRDREERRSKKPLALIQVEDQAMDELKRLYESSKKDAGTFFTVSRLPEDMAREITDLRLSSMKR